MKNLKNNLHIKILDCYNQYIEAGYQKDPAIYVIRANEKTCDAIVNFYKTYATIPDISVKEYKNCIYINDFKLLVDNRIDKGRVVFSPEQLEFKWSEGFKYGL